MACQGTPEIWTIYNRRIKGGNMDTILDRLELNPVRWLLLLFAGLGLAAAFGDVGEAMQVVGFIVFLLALAGIVWLLFCPTIVLPRTITKHAERVLDDPKGEYEHGYSISLVSFDRPVNTLRVLCDAPIHRAECQLEERGDRKPLPFRHLSSYRLSVVGFRQATGVHIRVYSKKPIRTVLVRERRHRSGRSR